MGEGGAIQSRLRAMFYTNVVGSSGLSVQNKACSHRVSELKLHARWQKASRRAAIQQKQLGDTKAAYGSEAQKQQRERTDCAGRSKKRRKKKKKTEK